MNVIKGHTYSIKSRGWGINVCFAFPGYRLVCKLLFSNTEFKGKDQTATAALHYEKARWGRAGGKIRFYLHTKWTSTVCILCLGIALCFGLGRVFKIFIFSSQVLLSSWTSLKLRQSTLLGLIHANSGLFKRKNIKITQNGQENALWEWLLMISRNLGSKIKPLSHFHKHNSKVWFIEEYLWHSPRRWRLKCF